MKFVEMIFFNRGEILEQAITEVFDEFTKFHNENRLHIEGWKTNDSWKVNKKIILPYYIETADYSNTFRLQFSNQDRMNDIDKVMAYISGKNYDHILTIGNALETRFDEIGRLSTGEKFENVVNSHFFKIKFFKKGTIHLEFKEEWLWKEFNMRACSLKKWLPPHEEREWRAKSEQKML